MCYEFAYNCDPSMIDEMDKLLKPDKYLMVSVLQLNYIYITDSSAIEQLKLYLRRKQIILHSIKPPEMEHIINFPDTVQLQKVNGNKALTGAFRELAKSYNKT